MMVGVDKGDAIRVASRFIWENGLRWTWGEPFHLGERFAMDMGGERVAEAVWRARLTGSAVVG